MSRAPLLLLAATAASGCCFFATPVQSHHGNVVTSVTFSQRRFLIDTPNRQPTTFCHGEGLELAVALLDRYDFWSLRSHYQDRNALDGGACTISVASMNARPRSVVVENVAEPQFCAVYHELWTRGFLRDDCQVCREGTGGRARAGRREAPQWSASIP
jgi:hypothetical protein